MPFRDPADPIAAEQMRPLIERGRARLRAYHSRFAIYDRPIGGDTMIVVEAGDFFANIVLCCRHVVANDTTIVVLNADGKPWFRVEPIGEHNK